MTITRIQVLALSLGVSIFASSAAGAQTTSASAAGPAATASSPASANAAATTKIGVVNIQDAILATEEGKKEFDALQQKFTPKQAELKSLNDEIESLKKQYQAQADKLNDDEKNSRAKTIDTKQKTLQRTYEDAQSEFQQAEQELLNRLGAKMVKTLEKYSQANGFSIVLDVSNPQTSPVLWATQGNVITKELVDAYNADYPVAGAAPKPAGATAPAVKAQPRPAGHATVPPSSSTTTPKKP